MKFALALLLLASRATAEAEAEVAIEAGSGEPHVAFEELPVPRYPEHQLDSCSEAIDNSEAIVTALHRAAARATRRWRWWRRKRWAAADVDNSEAISAALLKASHSDRAELELSNGWNAEFTASIGDAGARALAEALPRTNFTALELTYNYIGDAGARALAEALPKTRLTSINLRQNLIGNAGACALAEALPKTQLKEFMLSHAYIEKLDQDHWKHLPRESFDMAATSAFAEVLPQTQLTLLDLRWNGIGAAGARALAKALPKTQLTELCLHLNPIGDAGACALAEALPKTQIRNLQLHVTSLGDAGARCLAEALPKTQLLTEIGLHGNSIGDWHGSIGDAGARALAEARAEARRRTGRDITIDLKCDAADHGADCIGDKYNLTREPGQE